MHGAILGDVWGSVFEVIPGMARRQAMEPTDDSILTAACFYFCQGLTDNEVLDPWSHTTSILTKGILSLKECGRRFDGPGQFSPSFSRWANADGLALKNGDTNGCLMRQAPIALVCAARGTSLAATIEVARVYCATTHNSTPALAATEQHIRLLYQALNGSDRSTLGARPSLDYWALAMKKAPGQFIWKAQDSLDIALSGLAHSSSWEEMMDFFIDLSGDVDTYAAIAGPLAQCWYPSFGMQATLEACLEAAAGIEKSPTEGPWVLQSYRSMQQMFYTLKST